MTDAFTKNGSAEKLEGRSEQIESAAGQRSGGKVKRHCRRFWWLHILIFCAGFLIIALCLVYVAMPRIAQSGVNSSSLTFFDLQFLNPTLQTVSLTQEAQLHSTSMYTPTLDPFTAGLWLVTNGTFGPQPFANINFPTVHALHPNANVTFANQVLPILDIDQLTDYATQVLSQETVTTALTGTTKLHEGKLPVISIDYNSSTTYKALNGLKGFNTTNLKLNLTAPYANLLGNAYIPNPSVMTIQMGNVTFNMTTAEQGFIGNATILDFTLRPGDNNIPMAALINQTRVVKSMDTATGMIDLTIVGTSAIFNGEHITYYEKALMSNSLSLSLNVPAILATAV